ncbi:BQ5605_C029g10698 [Microbotryum silenes-dioicae]|uniref:BQ5605_C029g10698 protein n=1 Tax=Microbotryum silenes-dioicae TaxID=796604 RepID=A0A2X0PK52_9BASI|nr:BQ5605_C029g10698 [Microbotryum silenes-dioicae]
MSSTSGDEGGPGGGGRRASGRVRKAPERLKPGTATAAKNKRTSISERDLNSQAEDEDEENEEEDDSMPSETESEEEAEAFKSSGKKRVARPKALSAKLAVASSASKRKPSISARRAPRKKKIPAEGEDGQAEGFALGALAKGDFKIKDDNSIFNAVRDRNSALETTVEDWFEQYSEEPGPAMAELVNFLLRSCGCNSSVDEHQAVDEDGVVETLSDIQDEFKNETSLAYPVVSRSAAYKKFRGSLSAFISKLFHSAASSDVLYESDFSNVVLPWIVTLSSSKIRSFRHTATLFGMYSVAGLSATHAGVKKEHATANRAVEAETRKARKDKTRLKELKKTVEAIQNKQQQIEVTIKSLWDTIFVNRYRDTDAGIRSECIAAFSVLIKINPDYWIDGMHMRYIGWVLSDESKEPRREAVRALFSLYAKKAYIGAVQHFTERFKGPIVQMAIGDVDTTIRVQTIQVLRQLEDYGLLDEDQSDEIAKLIFETEPRVRRAAADFFIRVWTEEVAEREKEISTGREPSAAGKKKGSGVPEETKKQIRLKTLAEMLIKYGNAIDGIDDGEDDDEASGDGDTAKEADMADVKTHHGRVAFAVEALWDNLDTVQEWQSIMEFLLLDHSGASGKGGRKGKGRATQPAEGDKVEESCKLVEEEESLLVEVFVASITRVIAAAQATSKKGKEQDDEVQADVTRAVIEALPRLFAKHQMVLARIIDILAIPRLLLLDVYLDLRMVTAYEGLWDAVTTQFFKHSDSDVLDQATQTIMYLRKASSLANTNTEKMAGLEEKLVSTLREVVAGKDLESDGFEEDELHAVTACFARFDRLYKVVDLSEALQNDDKGKQNSVMEIVESVVERGRLGYKDEAAMVQHALSIQGTFVMWETLNLTKKAAENDQTDYGAIASLVERRGNMVDKLEEFSVGQTSNAAEGVKQKALVILLDAHILSCAITSAKSDPDGKLTDLRLTCSDELQSRCAGVVEAEIERRCEELQAFWAEDDEQNEKNKEEADGEDDEDSDEMDSDEDTTPGKKGKKKGKGGKATKAKKKAPVAKPAPTAAELRAKRLKEQTRLVASRKFERAILPFVRAMHSGVIELRHAGVILPHFERLGPVYDSWCRLLVQDLRDEGIYARSGELVVTVITTCLQTACEVLIGGEAKVSDEQLVAVGRLLATATAVRGAQLAIVRRLPADELVNLHTTALRYIIRKVGNLDQASKSTARNRAFSYFKALAHLLLGVEGRSALTLNSTLESLLEENEVEISPTSKTWEPLRSYKKRLVTAMSKDPRIQLAAAKKAEAAAGEIKDEVVEEGQKKGKGKKRASPENDHEGDLAEDRDEEEGEATTSKRRKVDRRMEGEESAEDDEEEVRSLLVGSSPTSSKRGAEDDEENAEDERMQEDGDEAAEDDDDNVSLVSLTDVKRSKRARR